MKKLVWMSLCCLLIGCSKIEDTKINIEEPPVVGTEQESSGTEKHNEIVIGDENFVADLDKIYMDIEAYEGKTIRYEGFIAEAGVDEEHLEHVVARYYEVADGDHTHKILVGLYNTYNGEWPEEGTWVEVEGTILKQGEPDAYYPLLEISKITVKEERGQEQVYN